MLSRQVVVKPEKHHARLAGFTLIELLAVLVIISSTSWLLIRAFDPSSHSTFQFSQAFSQYVMSAQSYALANQSDSTKVTLSLQSSDGFPALHLSQNEALLAKYVHNSKLGVEVLKDGAALREYDFVFDKKAMLSSASEASLKLLINSATSYCVLANGSLRPSREGC